MEWFTENEKFAHLQGVQSFSFRVYKIGKTPKDMKILLEKKILHTFNLGNPFVATTQGVHYRLDFCLGAL